MIVVGTGTDSNDASIYGVPTMGQTLGAIIMNKADMVSSYFQNFTFKNTHCQLRLKDVSFRPVGNKERARNRT